MTKVVGLTGGIGSGKSTIAAYFASMGVPVYIADDEAKKILYTPEASAQIKQAFGDKVFTDGIPDRQKISYLVFNSPEKLQVLNSIIHPKVRAHFLKWVHNNSSSSFVIKEAAILFESGSYMDCDEIILVTAPLETRIARVMQRDNADRERVIERIAAPWDDSKKIALSDYVIENTDLQASKDQTYAIFTDLTRKYLQRC